jgi:transposase
LCAPCARGRLWFLCFRENSNAALFIEFLEGLLHDLRKKVVLVIDRHPAHRAASVLRFLRERQDRLSVHFLPAYAPELNPDEHVWSALKRLFRTDPLDAKEDIEEAVSAVMHKTQRDRTG